MKNYLTKSPQPDGQGNFGICTWSHKMTRFAPSLLYLPLLSLDLFSRSIVICSNSCCHLLLVAHCASRCGVSSRRRV